LLNAEGHIDIKDGCRNKESPKRVKRGAGSGFEKASTVLFAEEGAKIVV
jgi:hypothetical protein